MSGSAHIGPQGPVQRNRWISDDHYRTAITTLLTALVGYAVVMFHSVPSDIRVLDTKLDNVLDRAEREHARIWDEIRDLKNSLRAIEDRERQRGDRP